VTWERGRNPKQTGSRRKESRLGTFGSAPFFEALGHVVHGESASLINYYGVQRDTSGPHVRLCARKTTFAMPGRSDGDTIRYSPVAYREEHIPLYPLESSTSTNPKKLHSSAYIDGRFYYAADEAQNLVFADLQQKGQALKPSYDDNGRFRRDSEQRIIGEIVPMQGTVSRICCERATTIEKLRRTVTDPGILLRLAVMGSISGLFDTGIYYFGKYNERRKIVHQQLARTLAKHGDVIGNVIGDNSSSNGNTFWTLFGPIPISTPQAQAQAARLDAKQTALTAAQLATQNASNLEQSQQQQQQQGLLQSLQQQGGTPGATVLPSPSFISTG